MTTFRSFAELVEALERDEPDAPAILATGGTWSRARLARTARSLAARWHAAGVEPGSMVLLRGRGGPSFVVAMLASAAAGHGIAILDPEVPDEVVELAIRQLRPRAIALCEGTRPSSSGLPAYAFDANGSSTLPDAPGCEISAASVVDARPLADLSLVTSGSTGVPRLALFGAAQIAANIDAARQRLPCCPGEVFLQLLPLSHAFGLVTSALAPLACGGALLFPPSPNPNRVLDAALAAPGMRVHLVPSQLAALTREIAIHPERAAILDHLRRHLRAIVCGAAPLDPELAARIADAGLPLWTGYGLTEAGPVVTLGEVATTPRGSVGRALPGIEVAIADDGEILVRTPSALTAYAGGDTPVDGGGWLYTGDSGSVGGDGHLFVRGRRSGAIVTSGGEKLAPEEIEAAYASPLFAEVCAVGVPDAAGGARPHLVLVPARGAPDATGIASEWRRLSGCAGRLRAFGFTLRGTPLPRSWSGKIRRDLARADALRARGSEP